MNFTHRIAVLQSILPLFHACNQRSRLQAGFLGDYEPGPQVGHLDDDASALQDFRSLLLAPVVHKF